MTQAARATAAAPTYFEPVEVADVGGSRTYPLVDGGVYAVNPSMCAYADVAGRAGSTSCADALARHGRPHPPPTPTTRRAGGARSSGRGR